MLLNVFSCTSVLSCIFGGVCSDLPPVFKLGGLFSYCLVLRVLRMFFMSFIGCVFSKYFLLACGFSLDSLDSVFCRAVFNFNEVKFLHGSSGLQK